MVLMATHDGPDLGEKYSIFDAGFYRKAGERIRAVAHLLD